MSFLFYCTSAGGLRRATTDGIRDAVVFTSLRSARRTGSSHIIVVAGEKVKGLHLHDSTSGYVSFISPDAVLNVQPYFRPVTVIAAGGIVLDEDGSHILLIRRRGLWDLPKGKREKGEHTALNAFREVCEETGISRLEVHRLLGTTVHSYVRAKRFTIKESYWYLMRSPERIFEPAKEEGIDAVEWVPREQASSRLGYAVLRRFMSDMELRHQLG